jgi:hypothetical protein
LIDGASFQQLLQKKSIDHCDENPISASKWASSAMAGPKIGFNVITEGCFSLWHQKIRPKSVKKPLFSINFEELQHARLVVVVVLMVCNVMQYTQIMSNGRRSLWHY